MSKKLWSLVGLFVIASLLLTACQPEVRYAVTVVAGTPQVVTKTEVKTETKQVVITATPKPVDKAKIMRVNINTFPDNLDPQKASFIGEMAHLWLVYEGLTAFNEKLETVPASAEKWEYNQDATEITFTLRKGLKYSDGSLVNARRFAYAIKRNIDPHTGGEYATLTNMIKGAEEWQGADLEKVKPEDLKKLEAEYDKNVQALDTSGKACKTGADGYKQEDCLVLKFTLTQPTPFFHTLMAMQVTFPAKEENIAAGKDIWWTSPKHQVGNGPFIMKAMEPYVRSRFEPNPNYWGGQAKIAIEYSYINDSAVAFQAYKNNEFDVVVLASEDWDTIKADPQLSKEAMIYPGSCTQAIFMHNDKEPFNDLNVRKAFALSLDRDGFVKDVLRGLGSTTLTWIPKGYPGYKEGETRWAFNPAEAKKLIAASKYGSVDKLPPITASFGDTPRNRTRWEWLAKKWKENLGVDIKLNPVESTTYTGLTKDRKTSPQMYGPLGWCADYPDPQNWLSTYWKTGTFGDRVGYGNKELDKLLNQADSTADPKARMDLYQKAQDIVINELPIAPAYNTVNQFLVKPWVKGMKPTPQDMQFPGSYTPTSIDIDTSLLPK